MAIILVLLIGFVAGIVFQHTIEHRHEKPPEWYTANELHDLLRREESVATANRLSVEYAKNLQLAFNKGYEMGLRK